MFNTSTPLTEKEINIAIKAVDDLLCELLPYIKQIWPELIYT